ncbi:MAG: hypothetical protein JSR58_01135 [Verrucomicrobia bacterium]|nr:hypothetical protein [Verrucomicrobiota bacterium]
MKLMAGIVSLCLFGYGFWWVSHKNPDLKNKVEELLDVGNFHTLEVRHSANQIMEKHRKELLKDSRHRYLEPELHFYPYLLLEVKYTLQDDKTQENVILWDMTDGEMVINTRNWDKTHGFGDCITAETTPQEFKILSLLAKRGGAIDRDGLGKALSVEDEILGGWIESCRRKKLVVQSGNLFRLHLKHPRLRTIPETKVEDWLVTKPYKNAIRLNRRYTNSQVERIAKAAFGQNFAIRRTVDVYLPVHSIAVQNPDGTIHTTHWNALNGKQLLRTYFIE